MIKDSLEHLIKIATDDPYSNDLLVARKEYQKYTGDIFEDDKSYENQMALFLEWYIFERIDPTYDQTVLESIINKGKEISPYLLKNISKFTSNIHGLFTIKKIRDHSIRVINLFDEEQYDVVESSSKLYFSKGSVFDGRLLLHEGSYYFTGNFCFHPEGSKNFIKSEIKKITSLQKLHEKESGSQKSEMNKEAKKLNKIVGDIRRLEEKVQKLNDDKKISKIREELNKLESIRAKHEENCSLLEKKITIFTDEKIYRENKFSRIQLMLKLSYMQLLLERSRNIEVKGIYKN
jgi:hypothetical protein